MKNIASIPPTRSLKGRILLGAQITYYDDWPYKIIYASDGIEGSTLMKHLSSFYKKNPNIKFSRRPNVIHVAGKYLIVRHREGVFVRSARDQTRRYSLKSGEFTIMKAPYADVQALLLVIAELQQAAVGSAYVYYQYSEMMNEIMKFQAISRK